MISPKNYILIVVIGLIIGAIYFINSRSASRDGSGTAVTVITRPTSDSSMAKMQLYELAKEITTPDGFINTDSKPLTIGEFVGKRVVLIDFWTYSCINCQRTIPYLNAWYEKYKDKGLVIIGIHTPEFEFEKDYDNVRTAVEKFGIKFPVVLDNDYSTWTAYKNQYWPRKYLIDIEGFVVYDHIGEGAYEETEKKIQETLSERMSILGESGEINQTVTKEVSVLGGSRSPEIYFGASRNKLFGNGLAGVVGDQKGLIVPAQINPNTLYLSGDWNITEEFSENKSNQAKIVFRYQARNVYFVAGSENGTKIKIIKDGKLISEQTVKEHTLYQIIQNPELGEHMLEIIIENPGLRAFTFTFG